MKILIPTPAPERCANCPGASCLLPYFQVRRARISVPLKVFTEINFFTGKDFA
jgi:hypothetical protein